MTNSTVYALYNRSRSIAITLSVLMLAEFAGTVRILWVQKNLVFYQTCLLLQLTKHGRYQRSVLATLFVSASKSLDLLSVLGFIIHCILIGLPLFKYFLAFRAGWNRAPLVSLVVRDSSTMYATVVCE